MTTRIHPIGAALIALALAASATTALAEGKMYRKGGGSGEHSGQQMRQGGGGGNGTMTRQHAGSGIEGEDAIRQQLQSLRHSNSQTLTTTP